MKRSSLIVVAGIGMGVLFLVACGKKDDSSAAPADSAPIATVAAPVVATTHVTATATVTVPAPVVVHMAGGAGGAAVVVPPVVVAGAGGAAHGAPIRIPAKH